MNTTRKKIEFADRMPDEELFDEAYEILESNFIKNGDIDFCIMVAKMSLMLDIKDLVEFMKLFENRLEKYKTTR
ncbi:hypothetical protein AB6D67_25210 [Vibrio splendidus]